MAQGGCVHAWESIETCCQIWSLPIHQPNVWSLVLCQHTGLEWSLLQKLLQITYQFPLLLVSIDFSYSLQHQLDVSGCVQLNLRHQSSLGQVVKIKWLYLHINIIQYLPLNLCSGVVWAIPAVSIALLHLGHPWLTNTFHSGLPAHVHYSWPYVALNLICLVLLNSSIVCVYVMYTCISLTYSPAL